MTSVWRFGHERDVLNHAPPTVSVNFWMKCLLYIQSICSRKNKPCSLFSSFNILFLLEVHHNTEVETVANFRFTQTLIAKFLIKNYITHNPEEWSTNQRRWCYHGNRNHFKISSTTSHRSMGNNIFKLIFVPSFISDIAIYLIFLISKNNQ